MQYTKNLEYYDEYILQTHLALRHQSDKKQRSTYNSMIQNPKTLINQRFYDFE